MTVATFRATNKMLGEKRNGRQAGSVFRVLEGKRRMDFAGVMLIGRLGGDPEFHPTVAGDGVCRFRLAVNAEDDGRRRTTWRRVSAYGRPGDTACDRLRKGHAVFVSGALRPQSWIDREGSSRYSLDVVAHEIVFLERRAGAGSPPPAAPSSVGEAPAFADKGAPVALGPAEFVSDEGASSAGSAEETARPPFKVERLLNDDFNRLRLPCRFRFTVGRDGRVRNGGGGWSGFGGRRTRARQVRLGFHRTVSGATLPERPDRRVGRRRSAPAPPGSFRRVRQCPQTSQRPSASALPFISLRYCCVGVGIIIKTREPIKRFVAPGRAWEHSDRIRSWAEPA